MTTAQFGNPWHDEIGRFAPKGQGSTSGGADGDEPGRATFKDKVQRKLHELVDRFMEDLDEDLGSATWDPVGLVPYATRRRGRRGKLRDRWAALMAQAIREVD